MTKATIANTQQAPAFNAKKSRVRVYGLVSVLLQALVLVVAILAVGPLG